MIILAQEISIQECVVMGWMFTLAAGVFCYYLYVSHKE